MEIDKIIIIIKKLINTYSFKTARFASLHKHYCTPPEIRNKSTIVK